MPPVRHPHTTSPPGLKDVEPKVLAKARRMALVRRVARGISELRVSRAIVAAWVVALGGLPNCRCGIP